MYLTQGPHRAVQRHPDGTALSHVDGDAVRRIRWAERADAVACRATVLAAHGMLSVAWLGRRLTDWVPQQRLREFGVRFTALTQVGEVITCFGTVTEVFEHRGERRACLAIQTANPQGQVKLVGDATVAPD